MNSISMAQIGQVDLNTNMESQEFKAKLQNERNEWKSFESVLKKAQQNKDKQALKNAAQDLEQIFLSMMFKTMRSSVLKSGLLEESAQRKIFEDMMFDEYAGQMAKAGGIGLSDMIMRDFERRDAQSE